MSHYLVGVILPDDLPKEDTEHYIARVLAPYDENMDVAPYKVRYSTDDLIRMANFYGREKQVQVGEIKDLVEHMKDWSGGEGGIDELGIYSMSTYNPNSKWDWYTIGGRWDNHIGDDNTAVLSDIADDEDKLPFALVTPVGNWVEKGKMGWFGMVSDRVSPDLWEHQLKDVTDAYGHCRIVGVDCHI